jgi:hypothetical protein
MEAYGTILEAIRACPVTGGLKHPPAKAVFNTASICGIPEDTSDGP